MQVKITDDVRSEISQNRKTNSQNRNRQFALHKNIFYH